MEGSKLWEESSEDSQNIAYSAIAHEITVNSEVSRDDKQSPNMKAKTVILAKIPNKPVVEKAVEEESLDDIIQLYQCAKCSEKFSELIELREHVKAHTGQKSKSTSEELPTNWHCTECDVYFENKKSLNQHLSDHLLGKYECGKCNIKFKSHASFKTHMRGHKDKKNYVCNVCNASFYQSGHLYIHKKKHDGENPYNCEICHTAFAKLSILKAHIRTHSKKKAYKCEDCEASFNQKNTLARHKLKHVENKTYTCQICDMKFYVRNNLRRHLNTHTGKKPYHCDICNSSFGQSIDLKRHKISHTGIKPFKCDECDAAYSRKSNLKWHKMTHSENGEHQCEICFVGFSTTQDLKSHMRSHAPPKPHCCQVCPASFRRLEALHRHKTVHTGEKPLRVRSQTRFVNKPKPYKCVLCNSTFSEKRSLRRHTFLVHKKLATFVDETEILEFDAKSGLVIDEQMKIKTSKNVPKVNKKRAGKKTSSIPTSLVQKDGSLSTFQQFFLESVNSSDNVMHKSQGSASTSGPGPRVARPAGNCQNHSQHFVTMSDGTPGSGQTWCCCDPPNIPETQTHYIVSDTSHVNAMNSMIVGNPVQDAVVDSTAQLLMALGSSGGNCNTPIMFNANNSSINAASGAPHVVYATQPRMQHNIW